MTREQARSKLYEMIEVAEKGFCFSALEEKPGLIELLAPEKYVYLTGDTHGQFERIIDFCDAAKLVAGNTLIILGDVGLNYHGDFRDRERKDCLSRIPVTFFCIHGNHEARPSTELGYELQEYHGGQVWVQPQYPNIIFSIDGEVYDFCGHACLVIGGAYSVDKHYRLSRGFSWWADEQPSDETKAKIEHTLSARDWKVDVVLSHTCPIRYEPVEAFLSGVDQNNVDKTTEQWLGKIESLLKYERWYCGHYHIEKRIDKLRFMFNDYALLPIKLTTEEENECLRQMI